MTIHTEILIFISFFYPLLCELPVLVIFSVVLITLTLMRHHQGCRSACLQLLLCLFVKLATGQSPQQSADYLRTVDSKMANFSNNAERSTQHTLDALISEEKSMQKKMAVSDPAASKRLFGYALDSLQRMKAAISGSTAKTGHLLAGNYFPYTDSLRQTLAFLQQTGQKGAALNSKVNSQLSSSLGQVNALEGKLNTIAVIQNFIQQRQQLLTGVLGKLPQYTGNLQQLSKTGYYYSAQITTYKNTLKDPAAIERKMLDQINTSAVFQDLLQHNGQLAGLFVPRTAFARLPLTSNPVTGLPARAQLQQYFREHAPTLTDTTDPVAQLTKKFTAAGSQLQQTGGAPGGTAAPGLSMLPPGAPALPSSTSTIPATTTTPNTQKTKTFGQRLQYGIDLQFGQAVSYLPATSNFGLKLGYKLNDKLTAGIGVDYLFGMGTGWKDLHFTNQGVGLRSYATWQIKKGWNIQGGAEANYMSAFTSIRQLRGLQQWQTSALLGLSKQYRVSRKISGNVQVLYDFLYQQHLPTTQPILFRLGYDLK